MTPWTLYPTVTQIQQGTTPPLTPGASTTGSLPAASADPSAGPSSNPSQVLPPSDAVYCLPPINMWVHKINFQFVFKLCVQALCSSLVG